MESKSKWESKTLWANAIGGAALLGTAAGFDVFESGQQEALVGGIMVIINIILRFLTKTALA